MDEYYYDLAGRLSQAKVISESPALTLFIDYEHDIYGNMLSRKTSEDGFGVPDPEEPGPAGLYFENRTYVDNQITIKPREKPKAEEVERRIADRIKRMADLEARRIWVTTTDGVVHLHGTVHSLHEKRLAEEAALAVPGVTKIENDLTVVP